MPLVTLLLILFLIARFIKSSKLKIGLLIGLCLIFPVLHNIALSFVLSKNWQSADCPLNKVLFEETLIDGEQAIGFYHLLLGPYEYRSKATGEVLWSE